MSGTLVKNITFKWMLFGIAILNFLYAPLLLSLKNPPTKEEKKVLSKLKAMNQICLIVLNLFQSLLTGENSSVRYVTYENEDDEE